MTSFPSICLPPTVHRARPALAAIYLATTTQAPAARSKVRLDTVNPGFYGLRSPDTANISPWTITHDSGSRGCRYDPCSYAEADYGHFYGN